MNVHPSAVISAGVELGERVVVGPHAVLLGPCLIGDDVRLGSGCVIGSPPEITAVEQNSAWNGELAHRGVEIGAGTVVRELASVQQGSLAPTTIGAGCWLLTRSYVAHDCTIGDGVTISAGAALGGYVVVGDRVTVGMNATVHQRRRIGPGAMVGMSAAVVRDIPPFAMAYGNPARVRGANVIGMTRQGFEQAAADALDQAYRSGGPVPASAGTAALRDALDRWSTRTAPATD